jgi:hypothetical protein
VIDRDPRAHAQACADVDQLAGLEVAPAGVVVHRLGGEDHRRRLGQVAAAHMDPAGRARVLEAVRAGRPARPAFQDEEVVRLRIAQRPLLVAARDDHVQGVERQLSRDPGSGSRQCRADVSAVGVDLLRDEREEALAVCVAAHQRAVLAELLLEPVETLDDTVVREHAPALDEGVRVLGAQTAGGGEAHVREEVGGLDLARLERERRVLPGGDRRLVHPGDSVVVEPAETGAVRLQPALCAESVGRVDQPEGRARWARACGHTKEPAHRSIVERAGAKKLARQAGCCDSAASGCRSPSPSRCAGA